MATADEERQCVEEAIKCGKATFLSIPSTANTAEVYEKFERVAVPSDLDSTTKPTAFCRCKTCGQLLRFVPRQSNSSLRSHSLKKCSPPVPSAQLTMAAFLKKDASGAALTAAKNRMTDRLAELSALDIRPFQVASNQGFQGAVQEAISIGHR